MMYIFSITFPYFSAYLGFSTFWYIEDLRNHYREQLNNSKKPDEIINKIVDGKINKFYEEVCLTEQIFVMDGKIKVNKLISNFNNENNLNFKITNFYIYKLGQE